MSIGPTIAEITRVDYAKIFDTNVSGCLFTLQAVAKHMIACGIKGRIINLASQAGRRGEPLVAVYCASKAAVISLTQSAGLNLIEHGINVNAIAPGVVDGEHWDGVDAFFVKYEGKAPGQKSVKSALICLLGVWQRQMTRLESRYFQRVMRRPISWRRHIMLIAGTG